MDASQYKDYILTLLFMKYVSDKYAGDPDAMIEVPEVGSFDDMVALVEYILVHELVHLLERHHNDRFRGSLDRFLPTWQLSWDVLRREPLGHEDWVY